jgi:hypothetical protein
LAELMVVMVAFVVITAAIFGLYLQCLRIWYRSDAEATAEQRAAWAVDQMSWDLRSALRVDEALPTRLTFTMPLQDANHDNVITIVDDVPRLSNGDMIMFYLSDESGSLTTEGNCLWKAVKPVGADSFQPRKKIAEDIYPELNPTDPGTGEPLPMFVYWPDALHTKGVQMAVTAQVKGGPHTYQRTEIAEAYLRNPT